MPIVFVHGVAVRDVDERRPELTRATRAFGEVAWPTIQAHLREHVAPAISDDPAGVPIMRVYWGDLGAQFAFGGRSLVSRPQDLPETAVQAVEAVEAVEGAVDTEPRGIRRLRDMATSLRRPVEDFVPVFLGDVMTYVATRGTSQSPGPIVERVLAGLEAAAFAAGSRGEPLVVLTHSMGGQVVYDIVTHFLPRLPEHRGVRIDFWCAAALQVGYFEELGLFLESEPDRGPAPTAYPPSEHLGGWWNVWDHADLLSFRAEGIIDGVDDSAFFAAGTLATDHYRYLRNADFYRTFASKVRASIGQTGHP
ncbi:hypothetical protein [Terrabacter sp. 2RAF25]|uniref:hypothetical protein n=1 Tax=Terrabacter sp. 2RAF25 TaxID=3232998 RepID=UPI003F96C640